LFQVVPPTGSEVQFGAMMLLILGAVSYYTNVLVNLVRMYAVIKLGYVLLMLSIIGPVLALLFWLTLDPGNTVQMLSQSMIATIVLGGFFGTAGALAANAAQSSALPTKPPTPATE
jgi:hypothetical protein